MSESIENMVPRSREEVYLKYIAEHLASLPVSVANGGTGATDVADARTNLNVYSKGEVDSLLSRLPLFDTEVVQQLPVEDISENTVYLVPSQSEASDMYKEYIYIHDDWELLGIQKADLTNFYTKSETDTLVNALRPTVLYANTSGSHNTITLSDSPRNYQFIEIYFKDGNTSRGDIRNSVRLRDYNSQSYEVPIVLDWVSSENQCVYANRGKIQVNYSDIRWSVNVSFEIDGVTTSPARIIDYDTTANPGVLITHVLGYR